MSVLEKIRKRTGLLIGVVGLALVVFILQLGKGDNLYAGGSSTNDNSAGEINGKNIDINTLQTRVMQIREDIKRGNQGRELDENQKNSSISQAWEELIRENVYNPQFEELGLVMSDEELHDQMLVHPHNMITSQFRDQQNPTGGFVKEYSNPDGTFNVKALNKLVSTFKEGSREDDMWSDLEEYVTQSRMMEKYSALVKGGLYTTTNEAKMRYKDQSTSYDVRYVFKKYSTISDSTVKVSDAEIQTYYNDHQYEFQNEIPSRSIEYVTWDVVPSQTDIDSTLSELNRVRAAFLTTPAEEDSSFTENENDGRIDIRSETKDKLSPVLDSAFYNGGNGNVAGPFREGNAYKLVKLRGTVQVNDSGKVRHILISVPSQQNPGVKRTVEQSKKLADSLKALLDKDRKRFEEFVEKYSDDPGKKKPNFKEAQKNPEMLKQLFPNPKDSMNHVGKGGNYGWVNEKSSFVESFKDFALTKKKGEIGIVPSPYGFHIMEVLEVSKTTKTKYNVATITRELKPSDATRKDYLQKASDFSGQNKTAEKFQKGVEALKLNKRLQEDMKEGDQYIPGFQNPDQSPKELIREVYKSNAGDVTKPILIGDKIVVALVTKVKNKGTIALEFVKDEVTAKVRDQKKADMIIADLKGKMNGAKNLDEFAAKTGLTIEKSDRLTFNSYAVQVYGREDGLIATSTISPVGKMTAPTAGVSGVWVLQVEKINPAPEVKDYKDQKNMFRNAYQMRIQQGEVNEALKKAANIEDHKAKFDIN